MAKKTKKTKAPLLKSPSTKRITCNLCNYSIEVAYTDPKWQMHREDCPRCREVETYHNVLFNWVLGVVEKNKGLNQYEVQNVIEERLNPSGYC